MWIVLLLIAGCYQEPDPPIRIATNPWPGTEFLFLAREKGFFEAEGVQVKLIELGSTADARRAFERGQTDVFSGTLIETRLAAENTQRLAKIFLITDYSNGSDMLLARPPIRSPIDLRGKRIALEPGSLDAVVVSRALQSAGLTFDDITIVPTTQIQMPELFVSGQIDAAQTYPPVSIAIRNLGRFNTVFDSSMIPGVIVDVLAADADLLTMRREDFAKIVRAFERAVRFWQQHPDEACRIMAARQRISPEEFKQALDGIRIVPVIEQPVLFAPGGVLEQAMQTTNNVLFQIRWVTDPGTHTGLLDPAPLNQALQPKP